MRRLTAFETTSRAVFAAVLSCAALNACKLGHSDDTPNSWPQFSTQRFTGTEDIPLDGQIVATDPGDTLTFTTFESPRHGTLTQLTRSGAFRYEPDENFNGADSFVAEVVDSAQHSLRAQILLEIAPVNDAPTAVADVFTVSSSQSLPVLANDTDAEGDPVTLESVGAVLIGTATVKADQTVDLQLPAGFKGVTRFSYRVREPAGLTAEATALVFVGIDPFKVVYLGSDGIFIDDLTTTYRASPPESSPTRIASMTASANGRALAYYTREATGDSYRVMYVELDEPGVARPVGPAASASVATGPVVHSYRISPDGRYLAFELAEATSSGVRTSLLLFDAQSSSPPVTLSSVIATRIGLDPQFSANSKRLYYVAPVPSSAGYHAVYRTDLGTGSATRVSALAGDFESFGGYWVADNESQLVVRYRRRAVGAFLYSNAYLVDPTEPDSPIALNPPFSDVEIAVPPTISRDGSHVFFTILGALPHPTGVVSPRIVPTAAPTGYQEVGAAETWTGAQTLGLDPSHMRGDSHALLFTTQWNMASTNLFEVMHDNPGNLMLVNAPTLASETLTNGCYSPDGERIFYIRRNTQSGTRALEMTRRAAFGTSTALSTPGDDIAAHQFDASGRVALLARGNEPEAPYALVNADAPQIYLPVDGRGASTAGTVVLVAR